MPRSDDVEYRWERIKNVYVPGYTLKRYVNRRRSKQLVPGWDGDLTVQQDINKERWLYGLSMKRGMGQRLERVTHSGHAATLEEARDAAERSLDLLSPQARERERQEDLADAFG